MPRTSPRTCCSPFFKNCTSTIATRGQFRGWLWTITHHKCLERQRRRREQAAGGSADDLDHVETTNNVAEMSEEEYRRYLVRRAMELMQAEFQENVWRACWLFVAEDKPAKEVAAELGVSVDVVYAAKSRVLRRLREELKGLME